MALSRNEEIYILGLIEGKTQRQAYLSAFPHSRKWKSETVDSKACALFHSDKVQERYREIKNKLKQEVENEAIVTVKGILQDLTEVKEVCMAHKEVPVLVSGRVSGAKIFNAAGANKALELLGRHLGMFEKCEQTANGDESGVLILPEVEKIE